MRFTVVAAASMLLAAASADLHRMKLKKAPLAEPLQSADLAAHAQALGRKYKGARRDGLTQDFTEVAAERGLALERVRFDGVLGLGFDSVSVNGVVPPLDNMLRQKLLDKPLFAVYLSNSTDGDEDEDGSEVVFGGFHHHRYTGHIVPLPLRRKAYWEVQIDAIAIGPDAVEFADAGAILDTGNPLIGLPADLADTLNRAIGAGKSTSGRNMIDCYQRREQHCMSPFRGMDLDDDDPPLVILGEPFLRRWYSIYDMSKHVVGLAKVK
ncbi:MAG: Vacuolar protease A [Phylliscum demangeonii]|nr:MAG: Vacuolar protease A [Phylliscum demangeonii]